MFPSATVPSCTSDIVVLQVGRVLISDDKSTSDDKWRDKTSILKECYVSRKSERINDFRRFGHDPSERTNYVDLYSRLDSQGTEGDGREKLGEWMKMTSVRSQDQRRILQSISHRFPSNVWIHIFHKITNVKESDRYDLYKDLWLTEGRFTTEKDLSPDDLEWNTIFHFKYHSK
jgi:hypothetical protein